MLQPQKKVGVEGDVIFACVRSLFPKNAAKVIFLAYFRSIVYTMQGQ
jgi:hypothetical protein